jgi:hypothetical protein
VRAARNSDLATVLGQQNALSPFAVAVTVLSLRGRAGHHDSALRFLDSALQSCEMHSAGCADHMPHSWRSLLQKQLSSHAAIVQSAILSNDPRLARGAAPLPEPSAFMPGATVTNLGLPYENFVLHAIALRLECLRLGAGAGKISASRLLPGAIGVLRRPPLVVGSGLAARHPADLAIAVALPTADANAFLASLCTQTAALLLPSSITMVLAQGMAQSVNMSRHFESGVGVPLPDLSTFEFSFDSVAVAAAADCPATFPVVVLNPQLSSQPHSSLIRQSLVAALSSAAQAKVAFDSVGFVATVLAQYGIDTGVFVPRVVAALDKMVALVERAVATRQALLIKPVDPVNPLCDICAIIPCALPVRSVFFLWFEVRDRRRASFQEKLDLANSAELLVGPAAERLALIGVTIAGTLLVPVARAPFNLVP